MKKLLIHGRGTGGGAGSIGTVEGVCDFQIGYDSVMNENPCTLYEAETTTFYTLYNWYDGDGFDLYLFGTFNVAPSALKVYVNGVDVTAATSKGESKDSWVVENINFDRFTNIYNLYIPVAIGSNTIEVTTADGTLVHRAIVELHEESGTDYANGTIVMVIPYAQPVPDITSYGIRIDVPNKTVAESLFDIDGTTKEYTPGVWLDWFEDDGYNPVEIVLLLEETDSFIPNPSDYDGRIKVSATWSDSGKKDLTPLSDVTAYGGSAPMLMNGMQATVAKIRCDNNNEGTLTVSIYIDGSFYKSFSVKLSYAI